MKTIFRESFWRDLKKIKMKEFLGRVDRIIAEAEGALGIAQIRNVKKMGGASNAYRIRVGGYRIGVFVEGDTVEFARCLARKDIYRQFP